MPRDLQQVVVVTDKRVEPDALVCAGDLQRRGGVSCSFGFRVKCVSQDESGQRLTEGLLTDKTEDLVHQVFEA